MLVSQGFDTALAATFGLLLGSFLNVVIHRLPLMMERQWAEDFRQPGSDEAVLAPLSLSTPRSRCPHCGHQLRWYENIPLLSFVVLRGKCSFCKASISIRYPAVEILTAVVFAWCVWRMPGQYAALAWCGFSAVLLTLALIDWDTTLLPDDLTLSLLWGGLLFSTAGMISVQLEDSVAGAAAGYMSLWAVYWVFKLATGKEGMGYGDFKLFAALGAWLGWQALVPIILIASLVGVAVGVVLKSTAGLRDGGHIPFGPFLVAGGFLVMTFGPAPLLHLIGL